MFYEKIQELSSHEKKEASMEKERLEKDKSNLKKKINEILNEKDILRNNIERKDKQIKEIEKTIETNNKKNEILKYGGKNYHYYYTIFIYIVK